MRKKQRASYAALFAVVLALLCSTAGISQAAHSATRNPDFLQRFVESRKVSAEITRQLALTGRAEVLLVLHDSDIRDAAVQLRKKSGMPHDSDEIIAERADRYRQRKEAVLSGMHSKNFTVVTDYENFPLMHMLVDEHALAHLLQKDEVSAFHENRAVLPFLTQSLPLIGALQAHSSGAAGAGTSVAVLDTGVNYMLSSFGSCTAPGVPASCKVTYTRDFAPEDGTLDSSGHGTNVSGIVVGVAPDTKIIGLDVFRTDGYAYSSDIALALDWVLSNRSTYNIVAVNMSLGSGKYTSPCSGSTLSSAITNLKTAGIATAIASGNSNYLDGIAWPACIPDAISVGAVYDADVGGLSWSSGCTDYTTAADRVTCFSNSASFLTLLAPGALINAANYVMGGTSQAAPHAAGSVAVLREVDPALTVDGIIAKLTGTGLPITDHRNSIEKKRIDLYGAVYAAGPLISVTQTSLEVIGIEHGAQPPTQTLSITNSGGGTLSWNLNTDAPWLTLSPPSGTNTGSVSVSVNSAGLIAGTYKASVSVTAPDAINSPMTVPVTLEVADSAYSEDFESGTIISPPWSTGGDGIWTVQNTERTLAAEAPKNMGDSQASFLEVALNVTSPGYVYFWLKTSTEPQWDNLKFRVDGVNSGKWDGWHGETGWMQVRSEYAVTPGIHTFRWEFSKDASVSLGTDTVWIDDIIFPPYNLQVPDIAASSVSLDFGSIRTGTTSSSHTLTVSNTGSGPLVLGTVSLTGTHAAEFTKQSDSCSGQTLAPSVDCTVTLKFSPQSTGSKSATLAISSNDPDTPLLNIPLSGTGILYYTLTVAKTGTGTGTITSSTAGINCGADCTEPYPQGTAVELIATPGTDSLFSGWSGGGCSGTGPCTTTITADSTVTAAFTLLPPIANFMATPVTGTAPLQVTFTDTSSNNPLSWAWDFNNDGIIDSTQRNPVFAYKNAGTYSVSLTVTNAGGSSTATKSTYITAQSCSNFPARIAGASPSYYGTVQEAHDAAVSGETIQLQAVDFTGDLILNRPVDVTLAGGYDCDYTSTIAPATVQGTLTISAGTVTFDGLTLQ